MNECPGCGRNYIEWTDTYIDRGYQIERKWWGCPLLRDASLPGEMRLHGGRWYRGKMSPLVKVNAHG